MEYYLGFVLICLLLGLTLGYFLARKALGEKAAQQSLRYAGMGIFFGILTILPILFFSDGAEFFKYLIWILLFLGTAYLIFFLFRSKDFMGKALKTCNSTLQNKVLIGVGIFQIVSQLLMLLGRFPSFLDDRLSIFEILTQISSSLLILISGIYFIVVGGSRVKLYEEGISVMGAFVLWKKFTEYKFEKIKQNTFRAKYKNDIPFIPGVINLAISDQDKPDFVLIVTSKLLEIELAT